MRHMYEGWAAKLVDRNVETCAMRLLMENITLENETQRKFNKDYALRDLF